VRRKSDFATSTRNIRLVIVKLYTPLSDEWPPRLIEIGARLPWACCPFAPELSERRSTTSQNFANLSCTQWDCRESELAIFRELVCPALQYLAEVPEYQ
jgi:hypothetical protein